MVLAPLSFLYLIGCFWQVQTEVQRVDSLESSVTSAAVKEMPGEFDLDQINWDKVLQANPILKRVLDTVDFSKKVAKWHKDYDQIDWDSEISKSPVIAAALGGQPKVSQNITSLGTGNTYSNCNITFRIVGSAVLEEVEAEKPKKNATVEKENQAPQ
jgi:hypothetical protein